MNKTLLIIQREYLSRVRKKTFILSTILTPLLFVGLIAAVVAITVNNATNEKVAVVDPGGIFKYSLQSSEQVTYDFRKDVDTSNFSSKGYSAVLLAPNSEMNKSSNFKIVSHKSLSRFANDRIHDDISKALENNLISQQLKIDPLLIDSLKHQAEHVGIEAVKTDESGNLSNSNFDVASGIGYVTGFLIYITLFIYGVMVMRGVMEEKTNRIAEVIVSSVKPFQLMLGKIIGIGAVGLTQFLIWIVLISSLSALAASFIPPDVLQQVHDAQQQIPGSATQTSEAINKLASAQQSLATINWGLLVACFIFYFLGGYLFYAALFAAVGSAVNEDAQDAQSLTFPITIPIILGIIIMINSINDPGSSLATWASIIPFFSPIVMMSRIPFGVPDTVPYWQLGLSMILLILGFLFTTWVSAKIYRTGILMYGKKPTWKEMIKWLTR
ncbi:ABC transporter permease [Chitinophagaceae bacterium LB-8]|uniref:ABC transporter permease n=1 Tax=Paraflavisolibacter caeni TaxID=2982496 RepID=A0A9X3BF26_9BACT|nr:ABC transporter permease [Paraflavisolibacter caeni]MCU7548124.1 ABC transporter permease [Paraflavisolibacter caeni]